jgi:SAM-dependent methyltransferase
MTPAEPRLGDFAEQARVYEARPGYPSALLDLLIEHVGVRAGDAVAEIGAGTGIFTRHLADRGLSVTAIEPSREMRAKAPDLDGVTWSSGSGEQTGLASASQRWLVAAQSFHWLDTGRGLAEARRVLVPGGHFTALWNDRDNHGSEILEETMAALRRLVPEYEHGYRTRPWGEIICSAGDFRSVVSHQVPHSVPMTRARYLDLWRSNNRICAAAGDRMEAFLDEVGRLFDLRGVAMVEVPYVCRAWTAITGERDEVES